MNSDVAKLCDFNLPAIESFSGEYRFLSNFYPSPIVFLTVTFPTVEHAFQAAKATRTSELTGIYLATTPGDAKRAGRTCRKREDWDAIKEHVMAFFLILKFKQPELVLKLIQTGRRPLVEGNTWGDTYWGVCNGEGRNRLGILLMQIRAAIVGDAQAPT